MYNGTFEVNNILVIVSYNDGSLIHIGTSDDSYQLESRENRIGECQDDDLFVFLIFRRMDCQDLF